MNSPEENITYIVEPTRSDLVHGASRPQVSGGETAGGNIDKIRDILFGNQMREYERRFSRLEERLVKEFTDSRDETKKRLDSIEVYVRQEIEALNEVLKKQQNAQEQAIRELSQDYKNQINSLDQKMTQFDENLSKSGREVRQQILEQSKSLNDEMKQKFAEILNVVERESQELRNDKANRSTLSMLFAEMAMRLRSE